MEVLQKTNILDETCQGSVSDAFFCFMNSSDFEDYV
jgi:ADP-ribosylglycohydrolase